MPASSFTYQFGFALAAALAIVTPAAAQSDDQALTPLPCEQTLSDSFKDAFNPESGIQVIDVGTVVKERGNNLCSILIDTTRSRIRFFFTSDRSINGLPLWRKVSITPGDYQPSAPYSPRLAPPPRAVPQPYVPPVVPVTAPPAEQSTSSGDPALLSFKLGKRDRMGWEQFFARITGDERDGAFWWSGQRSLKNAGSCSSGAKVDFRHGCEEAQAILGPSDVQRKTNPAYRAGWNSY